ncbi:DNA polymerase lambda [Phytophthora megakarya]|uniref:DNA polymerase n=1 Tax=Phytophthora megakarya TaxID=4795 RepID=A0A225WWQ5_9STRA|nr:DNA polymerase lambda [Phytophthora megakarya]
MRDLTKLGALQQEKRSVEGKPKGPAKKKSKRAGTLAVFPKAQLLQGKHVLLVPFGPDMGRKRLEILQGMVEKLGGSVVESQARSGTRAAPKVKWDDVNVVIASSQLKRDKAMEFLHVDKFPPPNVEVYTPEWLVFLRQEKKLPSAGTVLTWVEQQRVREEAEEHEQHCEDVAQQLEEKRVRKAKGDDSDSDEGSNSDNSDTRGIVRVPHIEINSEEVREQQKDLNEKNCKLVEERTPIFYKNNPGFRPINEEAVPGSKKIKGEGFICQRSSAVQQNLNAHLTDPLEEMMEFLDVERDVWRQYMYKKVVSSLKAMRHRVCNVKDFKDMNWVKGRLKDKVIEILETGRLAKLDAKKSNPRLRALVEIARIWGVGPVTAAKLYGQGYKSVADLRKPEATQVLTAQQQIGVKHYEDFLTKIPRAEVHQIEQTVVDEVHKMIPNAIALACGSYRRGKLSSGDCDVLVTDPDADTCDILPELLKRLHATGFLTGTLTFGPCFEDHLLTLRFHLQTI